MIVEILLGKNEESKDRLNYMKGSIRNIKEDIPLDQISKKFVNDLFD